MGDLTVDRSVRYVPCQVSIPPRTLTARTNTADVVRIFCFILSYPCSTTTILPLAPSLCRVPNIADPEPVCLSQDLWVAPCTHPAFRSEFEIERAVASHDSRLSTSEVPGLGRHLPVYVSILALSGSLSPSPSSYARPPSRRRHLPSPGHFLSLPPLWFLTGRSRSAAMRPGPNRATKCSTVSADAVQSYFESVRLPSLHLLRPQPPP